MHVRVALALHETLRFADVVLVVDLLRATTTATALFEQGLHTLILAESLASAQTLRQDGEVLVGEAGGLTPEAFDFGNSPLELRGKDFSGKTAVLTTSNGTRAAHLAARSSERVLLACLNNASAACRVATSLAEKEVAILCAGMAGKASPDDTYTAGILATRLVSLGLTPVGNGVKEALKLCQNNPDPFPLLTRAGAYLERLGFGDDVEACAQLDVTQTVGTMRGNRGGGLIFNAYTDPLDDPR